MDGFGAPAATELGGYRLVRRLGADHDAEVHLAVPVDDAGPAAVVVKIPTEHVGHAAVLAEADALWRARGEHVVPLLDAIDRGEAAPALVLDRVETALTTVVASGRLGRGAAATVLLPIAAAARAMHSAGIAHGAIGASTIRLDARGAPVLIGFSRAVRFAPGLSRAAIASTPAAVADALAIRSLARHLLAGSAALPGRAVDGLLAAVGDEDAVAADPDGWLEALEREVSERIAPGPVPIPAGPLPIPAAATTTDRAAGSAAPRRPRRNDARRADPPRVDRPPAADVDGSRRSRRVPARSPACSPGRSNGRSHGRSHGARGASIAGMLDSIGDRVAVAVAARLPSGAAGLLARVLRTIAPIRARVWVPALAVLIALVVAVVVVPTSDGEAVETSSSTTSGIGARRAPTGGSGAGDAGGWSIPPVAGADSGDERVASGGDGDNPDGADPDAAAPEHAAPEDAAVDLVTQRSVCLSARDPGCLGAVVQAGSPAEAADLVAIAAVTTPIAAAGWTAVDAVLVDLLGGAALVDVVIEADGGLATVPVLLVRNGDRWLIRTVLEASVIGPGA